MVEVIKDNLMTIVMFALTFLVGIGIGAGITEAINGWKQKK